MHSLTYLSLSRSEPDRDIRCMTDRSKGASVSILMFNQRAKSSMDTTRPPYLRSGIRILLAAPTFPTSNLSHPPPFRGDVCR